MNSQADILRQTLEDMANDGNSQFQMFGFERTDVGVSEQKATKIAAKNILEQFPEEDSEHVKAYRALVFLSRYLAENDFEDDYFVDQYTIEEQLGRVRHTIADEARSDILRRLEIDQDEFGGSEIQNPYIHDPVSKAHVQVSSTARQMDGMIDHRAEETAHEILEAPL